MKPSDGLMLETFQLNTKLITVKFAGNRYMKIKINTKMRDLRTKTVGNSLNVWIVLPNPVLNLFGYHSSSVL